MTVWHVARWLDVPGTRIFASRPAHADIWHRSGWREATGYEPHGIGYLGLGTLTGYTPEEIRAVPPLDAASLRAYLTEATDLLIGQIDRIAERGDTLTRQPAGHLSPYQQISMTLQGSFGHIGEIDALVALRARLTATR